MARSKNKDGGMGHNKGPALDEKPLEDIKVVLNSVVPRIERLIAERDSINEDIKDIYVEAKARGANNQVLRKVIAIRKTEREKAEEWAKVAAELDYYYGLID